MHCFYVYVIIEQNGVVLTLEGEKRNRCLMIWK